VALPNRTHMSEEEYLAFERESEIKHEYIDGEVYAMAGASENHNLILVNLITSLRPQLRSGNCRLYPSDMRLKVTDSIHTYPDLQIVCGASELTDEARDTLLNPTVIFEILSPSTEGYDRGEKFRNYRQIDSLQAYVLVSQDQPLIEVFLRSDSNQWTFTEASGLEAIAQLVPVECELSLAQVYEQISFDEPSE